MHKTVWRDIRSDSVSKSNMVHSLSGKPQSTIAIRAVEIIFYKRADRILERREAAIISGAAQMLAVGLGEILVAVSDLLGHVDIFDVLFGAECGIGRHDQVAEAARMAGTDIEDAANARALHQPHHDTQHVIDIDEVAPLIAVGYAVAMRLEQPDGFARLDVVEGFREHAHHRALVVLVRPEHVEELQP